jgi:hypothetical protein
LGCSICGMLVLPCCLCGQLASSIHLSYPPV